MGERTGEGGLSADADKDREAVIRIRLTPRSSVEGVSGRKDGVFRIKVTAPPVQGKANQAMIAFLSKTLGVSKSKLEIISGERSREKKVRVKGMTGSEVQNALEKKAVFVIRD